MRLLLLTLALALGSCGRQANSTLPFYNTADFTPEWISTDHAAYTALHTIAPFSFTNQNGKTITQAALADKIYVASFFFTTCAGICPKMTRQMLKLQDAFKNDPNIVLLSHSVMPATDTVPVLNHYAQRNQIQSGKWHLLTGPRDVIYRLARTSYFADKDVATAGPDDFLHTENFILVDKQQRIRGVYNGTLPLDTKRLIEDILILKAE
jgi:protein SCO1/2